MKTLRFSSSTFIIAAAILLELARAQVYGHWEKTWRTTSTAKRGMNIGIAFSGWNNVQRALRESAPVLRRLQGTGYISIGGGNANGRLSRHTLADINKAIRSGQFRQYRGIAYDVEEGDSGLSRDFERSFQLAKSRGFRVLVAVSHSAPYGIPDRNRLMKYFLSSRNIDYLSPMLYKGGRRSYCRWSNHISLEVWTVPWTWYRSSRAKVVPSLLHGRTYSYAKTFFRRHEVRTYGYIQWCP